MYASLHTHSYFSLLEGASSPHALIERAASLELPAMALTDHHGLYGAVRFYTAARKAGVKPLLGVELDLAEGGRVVLLATRSEGYTALCKLITRAQMAGEKGKAVARLEWVLERAGNLIALHSGSRQACFQGDSRQWLADYEKRLLALREGFGSGQLWVELQNHLGHPLENRLNHSLAEIARRHGLGLVASNNVHYAEKASFRLQDVLVCIGTLTSVQQAHPARKPNAEYYLKSPRQMAKLFADFPEALENTLTLADRCTVELDLESFHFPHFPLPEGETCRARLREEVYRGALKRYGELTAPRLERLEHELGIIQDFGFEEYFLVVHDLVRYARERAIRVTGRGSAADSIVSYTLGITEADPLEHNLLFERFINPERRGMPDIDLDFDSDRRDEVINYVYEKYGEDHVAAVCTFNTFRARSAIRDVAKALGFNTDELDKLAKVFPHIPARDLKLAFETVPEVRDSGIKPERLAELFELCEQLDGFPRHLGLHNGGLVLSRDPLTELAPLEKATKGLVVSQFDKDDVETLGLVKMDLLGLKMHTAIEEALRQIEANHGLRPDLERLPLDDEATYRLLRSAKTVGCFQVESPGMRGLLARLQPTEFEHLIINISLFRPGPMQADMITPYLARRHGKEPVVYPHPSLAPILKETLGVLIYQEQVLRIASALAGFSLGQADKFRRAMTHNRTAEEMQAIKAEFMAGCEARGVDAQTAKQVFKNLTAFAAYGFCKAHAACFAKIAYQTAWLKAHYPAELFAGILSSEPMGYYPSRVILQEARNWGIPVLPVDINESEGRFLAGPKGLRVGLAQVKDMDSAGLKSLLEARRQGRFSSLEDFCRRTKVSQQVVENLIDVGAFDACGLGREELLLGYARWRGQASREGFRGLLVEASPPAPRPGKRGKAPGVLEQLSLDYELLGLSTQPHPLQLKRAQLRRQGVLRSSELARLRPGSRARAAGVVVTRLRPATRSGAVVVFITLEDEVGLIDCVIFYDTYSKYGPVLMESAGLLVEGKLEQRGHSGLSLIVDTVEPLGLDKRTFRTVGGLPPTWAPTMPGFNRRPKPGEGQK